MKKRKIGIDLFKLCASIFVIGIHTYFLKDCGEPYYTIVDYIFRFAVPFFFACSGFFLMKKLKGKEEKEIKEEIKKYLKKILKLWLIWGTVYFFTGIIEKTITQNMDPMKAILKQTIKAILIQPGGGLWYLNTIIYTMIVLYFIYKSDKDLKKVTIIFGIFYLFNYLWSMELFQGTFIGTTYNKYISIMSSDRFFLFKGFYFIIGMNIGMYLQEIKIKKNIIILLICYISYILMSEIGNNIVILRLLSAVFKIIVTINLFKIAYYIKNNACDDKWLINNCGKMSHIIYFTGSLVILIVTTLESQMGFNTQQFYSINFVLCSIILIAYSIIILKTKIGKKIFNKIY